METVKSERRGVRERGKLGSRGSKGSFEF